MTEKQVDTMDKSLLDSVEDGNSKKFEEGPRKGDCCGFRSKDKKRRGRAFLICGALTLVTIGVILLIVFFAVVPAVVKHIFNSSEINVVGSTLSDPTNTTFVLKTDTTLSSSSPIPATVQFNDLTLSYNGKQLAKLSDIPSVKVSGSEPAVSLAGLATIIDSDAMTAFSSELITLNEFVWQMEGTADVKAIVNVKGVSLNKDLKLSGFQNFNAPGHPVNISEVKVASGDAKTLTVQATVEIYNPSPIGMDLKTDVLFDLYYKNVYMGTGTVPQFVIVPGQNTKTGPVIVAPTNKEQVATGYELLSQFAVGAKPAVEMKNFRAASNINFLKPGLEKMILASTMPSPEKPLIESAGLKLGEPLTSVVNMFNAFDVPVIVRGMESNVSYAGKDVASVNHIFTPPLTLPAKVVTKSPFLEATPNKENSASIIQPLLAGALKARIDAVLDVLVGDFPVKITYFQENVPMTLLTE